MTRFFCSKPLVLAPFIILAMECLFAFSAIAAPQNGPAGMAFYTAPATTDTKGTLIRYRTSTSVPPGGPSCYSWTIMYYSQDALGKANVVTGTVLVPKSIWWRFTPRPIISYAAGTHGFAQSWAPSIQLENGTDYESSNINAALNMGYAVLISDNPGYTNGSIPTYMAGIAQGHAVLDIVTAALQIPNISLQSTAQVGIWGYSQGGQSAAFAGEQQPTYAPGMNLVGVAAGGIPGEFFAVAKYLDGHHGSAFLLNTIIGLHTQYPEGIPLHALANTIGEAAVRKSLSVGVFEALFALMNTQLSSLVKGKMTHDELLNIDTVKATLAAQELGKTRIKAPLFLFHGTADQFIPLEQALDLKGKYCALGTNTSYMVFPGEHLTTLFEAAPYVLSWLTARFNGQTAYSTCVTLNKRPVSTANPVTGDFLFSIKGWTLSGVIHLKTLMQDVVLPDGSTFTAEANMTKNTIAGTQSVPAFARYLNVPIPLQISIEIAPAAPMTGTASLDKNGMLHIHGNMIVNLSITKVGIFGLGIIHPTLHTAEPINFPIDFDGPVSAAGDGSLTFKGTTTFPDMTGDSTWEGLFTSLMSGPGQTFTFTVTLPAPTAW